MVSDNLGVPLEPRERKVALTDWEGKPLYLDDEIVVIKSFRESIVLKDDIEDYIGTFPRTTVREYLEK